MPKTRGSRKNSNRYNNIVYIIASILLVAVLVFAGWYLYGQSRSMQQNNTANANQNNIKQDKISEPNNIDKNIAAADRIFKIPELGIQFVLPEGLEGLEYKMVDTGYVNEDGNHVNRQSAYFTTKKLRQADEHCTAGFIGAIGPIPLDTPRDDGAERWRVRLDNYALMFNGPQAGCSDKMDVGDLQTRQVNLLYESYKNTITLIAP